MKGLAIVKNPHLTFASPPPICSFFNPFCPPLVQREKQIGKEVRIFFLDRQGKQSVLGEDGIIYG